MSPRFQSMHSPRIKHSQGTLGRAGQGRAPRPASPLTPGSAQPLCLLAGKGAFPTGSVSNLESRRGGGLPPRAARDEKVWGKGSSSGTLGGARAFSPCSSEKPPQYAKPHPRLKWLPAAMLETLLLLLFMLPPLTLGPAGAPEHQHQHQRQRQQGQPDRRGKRATRRRRARRTPRHGYDGTGRDGTSLETRSRSRSSSRSLVFARDCRVRPLSPARETDTGAERERAIEETTAATASRALKGRRRRALKGRRGAQSGYADRKSLAGDKGA